jgi:hypothetical protein
MESSGDVRPYIGVLDQNMNQIDREVFLNYITKGVGTVSDNNRNACAILELKTQNATEVR